MKPIFLILIVLAFIAAVFAPIILGISNERATQASATVIFGGDMMFDRYIRQVASVASEDFIFSCIYPTLRAADLVVANLEGPITDHEPVGGMAFTFPPSTAALLAQHNIKIVNLGNNHSFDFGTEGVHSTRAYLDAAGVMYFGFPEARVATTSVGGIGLALVNYNEFGDDTAAHVVSAIGESRKEGLVPIVYAHWGEEYQSATTQEKELAHAFVDAGAELVVGSHPHVVQEHELYHGENIYYSLGNFIFDQYFSDDVRQGLLLKILFSERGISGIEEIPITLETDGRTCLPVSKNVFE